MKVNLEKRENTTVERSQILDFGYFVLSKDCSDIKHLDKMMHRGHWPGDVFAWLFKDIAFFYNV